VRDNRDENREEQGSPTLEVGGLVFGMRAKRFGRTVRVRLRGELDVASRDDFKSCLDSTLSEPLDNLVLDLADLTFIDSIGLKGIFDLCNRASKEGFALTVVPGGRQVQRAFNLSGLDQLIEQGLAKEPRVDAGNQKGYLHCPECRTPVYTREGRPLESCPTCAAELEPSPPSLFKGSVRHPGMRLRPGSTPH
jgi:anti-sigma B factor antagonist